MYIIQRFKIVLLVAVIMLPLAVSAQKIRQKNNAYYDFNRQVHFGFTIGTHFADFKYKYSDYWYRQDSILGIQTLSYPGITLGAVANFHLGSTKSLAREHFDLRAIPTLLLSQRSIKFTAGGKEVTKDIESATIELPVLLKFKSDRFFNTRFYVIGGGKYGYDLSSDIGTARDIFDPQIYLTPHNISYEFGAGLDMYMSFFKFSPEIKVSRGINNVLDPDLSPISRIFSGMRSNYIFISLYFEG